MDVLSRTQRSLNMSRIRGRDTRPELVVRRLLHSLGFRFRLCPQRLPGRPDVVLTRWRTVVLVHGCFWHRHHACRFATTPRTNVQFWRRKFAANRSRDRRVVKELRRLGWRVVVIWECDTRDPDALLRRLAGLRNPRQHDL